MKIKSSQVILDCHFENNFARGSEIKNNGNGSYSPVVFSSSSPNSQNYIFNMPKSVAVDNANNIWVANTGTSGSGNKSVTEIKNAGNNAYEPINFPTSQTISTPYVLTTDSLGNVWGVNFVNSSNFPTSSVFELAKNGSSYTPILYNNAIYRFQRPEAIAVDSDRNVWVPNSSNYTVTEMKAAENYLPNPSNIEQGNIWGFSNMNAIATDPNGNIWVASSAPYVTEMKNNLNGTYSPIIFDNAAYNFQHPIALTSDDSGNIWVFDSNTNQVTELIKQTNGLYGSHIFSQSQGGYQFNNVQTLTADHYGNIWVTNFGNSPTTGSIEEIKNVGGGNYTPYSLTDSAYFQYPEGIATDSAGNVWVTSFPSSGNGSVTEIKDPNSGSPIKINITENVYRPRSVAIDNAGHAWVTNRANSSVVEIKPTESGPYNTVIFNAAGGYIFNNILRGIATDSNGNVWTTGAQNNIGITEIRNLGHDTYVPGIYSGSSYGLGDSSYLATDLSGNVWITNTGTYSVTELVN